MAYDVYLDIISLVQKQLDHELGCDTPNWHALNSCPACQYRLENEPTLPYSKLISIDGNNSLCRVDPTLIRDCQPWVDTRLARSDYWLTSSEFDIFKDEVKAKAKHPVPPVSH